MTAVPVPVQTKRAFLNAAPVAASRTSLWCGYLFYLHVVRKDLINAGLFLKEEEPPRLAHAQVQSLIHPPHGASARAVACFALLELVSGSFLALRRSSPPVSHHNRGVPVERLHLVSPVLGLVGAASYGLFVQFYFVWFRGLKRAMEAPSPRAVRVAARKGQPGSARRALLLDASFGGGLGGGPDGGSTVAALIRVNYLRYRPPVLGPLRSCNASVFWRDFSFTLHVPIALVRKCEEIPFLVQFRLDDGVGKSLWSKKILSSFRLGQRLRAAADQRPWDRLGQ